MSCKGICKGLHQGWRGSPRRPMIAAVRGPGIPCVWLRLVLVVGVALGPACTEPNPYLSGFDSRGSEGSSTGTSGAETGTSSSMPTGSGDGSSSGGEPSACGDQAGLRCVPEAPEGFMGPFAWLEHSLAGTQPSCPAPFPEPLVEAFSDISAPAARCACDCGPFANGSCDGPASVDLHAAMECGGDPTPQALMPGCNPLPGPGWSASASYFFDAPPIQGGGCLPLPDVDRTPASFLTRHLACAGSFEAATGCAPGQQCMAVPGDPFQALACVGQEGDVECPAEYPERTVLYRDLDDQRSCQPCTCAKPTGPCEGATVVLARDGCATFAGSIMADSCVSGPGGPNLTALLYAPGMPIGECEPAVVVPVGDTSGTDPVTFCCGSL